MLHSNVDPELGYLLVGHGTRRLAGQDQFRKVYEQFASFLAPSRTELAFLELAEPTILVAMQRLAASGIRKVVGVPALLFSAGHALQDIPDALDQAAKKTGIEIVGQSAPLESSPSILELSALRFRQAVCQIGTAPICWQACENKRCGSIALIMVGRGGRSSEAAQQMRLFAQRRTQLTPVNRLETAFIVAQPPSVPETLAILAESTYETIVVQPHLLFEGELIDQLREQVADKQSANKFQNWIICSTLGTDIALAETLADLGSAVANPS